MINRQQLGWGITAIFVVVSSVNSAIAQDSGAEADGARDLLAKAIALAPDRPEAYFARALLPGELLASRLADVELAKERGLSDATYHAVRAHLLRGAGQNQAARVAEATVELMNCLLFMVCFYGQKAVISCS